MPTGRCRVYAFPIATQVRRMRPGSDQSHTHRRTPDQGPHSSLATKPARSDPHNRAPKAAPDQPVFVWRGGVRPGLLAGRTKWKKVGGEGFEPPKAFADRFTVCSNCPLWHPPIVVRPRRPGWKCRTDPPPRQGGSCPAGAPLSRPVSPRRPPARDPASSSPSRGPCAASSPPGGCSGGRSPPPHGPGSASSGPSAPPDTSCT